MKRGVTIAFEVSCPFVWSPRWGVDGVLWKFQWAWFGVYFIECGLVRMLNELSRKRRFG